MTSTACPLRQLAEQSTILEGLIDTDYLDAALADSPEWMQTEYKAMDVDWNNISANQSAWLEQWETNVIDADKNLASE